MKSDSPRNQRRLGDAARQGVADGLDELVNRNLAIPVLVGGAAIVDGS